MKRNSKSPISLNPRSPRQSCNKSPRKGGKDEVNIKGTIKPCVLHPPYGWKREEIRQYVKDHAIKFPPKIQTKITALKGELPINDVCKYISEQQKAGSLPRDGSGDETVKVNNLEDLKVPDISGAQETKSIQLSGVTIPLWLEYIVRENNLENVCVIDTVSTFDFLVPYTIMMNKKGFETYSGIFADSIARFVKSCNKRFMFIVIGLSSEGLGHANLAIIDRKKKIIERFEPHGGEFSEDKLFKDVFGDVDENLERIFDKFLKGYTYKKAKEICPYHGPQYKEEKGKETDKGNGGFCSAWSAFIMHLKMLNPDLETEKIIACVLKYSSKELSQIIRKYVGLIELKVGDKAYFKTNGIRYGVMEKLSPKLKKIILDYV